MEKISPYIPCLGITTGKHIYDHKNKSEPKLTEIHSEADSEADNPQTNE